MDRYFRQTGACGVQMMRATASTQLIIDYYSERDFVQKMRAACLLTPFFGLLSDNAPIYQGNRNNACSVRTRIWQDVDTDRCGVPPRLMDPDFGFDAYADTVLTRPLVVSCKGGHCKGVGRKTAQEIYGARLDRCEIEHILSMFFFDARVNGGIEIRGADCMPPKFILAYAQLVRSIFGSQAALQNVLRHYPGVTTVDIANAKLAVCKDGFNAWVYGKPIGGELAWLLMQARSRTPSQEERALLDPFMQLLTTRKTIRETENYNE